MTDNKSIEKRMSDLDVCVIIPTYNNARTLADVVNSVLDYTGNVIIVNDGSTDHTEKILERYHYLTIVSYKHNRGKGYALKSGFKIAERLGYRYAITIDSDGQHFASDIVTFVDLIEQNPDVFIAGQRITEGEMPSPNNFANKLSSFWINFLMLSKLRDTQNGFRLYPLWAMNGMRPLFNRYEAELELIVRCAWKGIKIMPAVTRVYYPPKEERVSHFRPGADFLRIAGLNTLFVFVAIFYGYPAMFYHRFIAKK